MGFRIPSSLHVSMAHSAKPRSEKAVVAAAASSEAEETFSIWGVWELGF